MDASGIQQTIDASLEMERHSDQLRNQLHGRLSELREVLVLPEEEPVDALMEFISAYIASVPSSLSLVTAVSRKLGFHQYAAPFLHIAEDFFIQPPEELEAAGGMEGLLDEAFLAHRLLEEVNDHHIRHLGNPLLPVDMTEANIIVHHLIGDRLANKLESLVQYTAGRLLDQEHLWQQAKTATGSEEIQERITSTNLLQKNMPRGQAAIRLRLPQG